MNELREYSYRIKISPTKDKAEGNWERNYNIEYDGSLPNELTTEIKLSLRQLLFNSLPPVDELSLEVKLKGY